MKKQKWHYKGPIYHEFDMVQAEYEAYTSARSPNEAISNILHKFAKEKLIPYRLVHNYDLSDLNLHLVPEDDGVQLSIFDEHLGG